MAIFPCDWSGHRYPGPQRSAYVICAFGEDVDTTKLRLCERHFRDYVARTAEHLALVQDDSSIGRVCDSCGKEKIYAVYVKLFDQHEEPAYYAGDLCPTCWERVRQDLLVSSGRPLARA